MRHPVRPIVVAALLGVWGTSDAFAAKRKPSPVRFTSLPKTVKPGATFIAVAKVPKGNTCALRVSKGSRTVGFASIPVRVASGPFTAGFTVAKKPAAGKWTAKLRCASSRKLYLAGKGRTATRTVTVKAPNGGRGLVLRADVVGVAPPLEGLGAVTGSHWGEVLVRAGDWAGGVDIKSNSPVGCPRPARDGGYPYCNVRGSTAFGGNGPMHDTGLQSQCVELTNRMLVARGWAAPIRGNAHEWYAKAPAASFDKHPRGNGYRPVPGDIAVHNTSKGSGFGHVAVVDRVVGNTVIVGQQNSGAPFASLHLTGKTVSETYIIGFLHAKANATSPSPGGGAAGGGDPATSPPTPRAADILSVEPNGSGGANYLFAVSRFDGTFARGFAVGATNVPAPVAVAAGDINGDGRTDIISAEPAGTGAASYVFALSLGNGHFTRGFAVGATNVPAPIAIAAGDINGN